MGLANTRDPNKLRDLAELLADPEWPARAGAARALAATGADGAALLLRYKARIGDSEPEVFSDSLSGLIEIDGAAAMPLAGALAELHDPAVRDAAVLALGASRRADAVELLKEKFGRTVDREAKRCILLALATARTEPALAFLKELIDEGNAAAKEAAAAVGLQSLS
jgi:HEAT repeat protein